MARKGNQLEPCLMVSAKQVAQMLGVSQRQVWRLRQQGALPEPRQIGGSIKWVRAEINTWIESGCPTR